MLYTEAFLSTNIRSEFCGISSSSKGLKICLLDNELWGYLTPEGEDSILVVKKSKTESVL